MKNSIKTTSKVTSSDGKININMENTTALANALRAAQQLYSAAARKSEYSSQISKLASILNAAIEDAITNALGGGRITPGSGGFFPDYVIEEDGNLAYKELKLVTIEETVNKKTGATEFRRGAVIGLAGGSGITLSRGMDSITTGFSTTTSIENGATRYATTAQSTTLGAKESSRFIDRLLAAGKDQAKLLSIISGQTTMAKSLKATLIAKANTIEIPINHGGVLKMVSIKFTWAEITRCLQSKKMRIEITPGDDIDLKTKKPNSVKMQLYFNTGVINEGLKSANLATLKIIDGPPGNFIQEALAKIASLPNKDSTKQIKLFLKELNFDAAARYIPGSVIISRGTIKYKNPKQATAVPANAPKPQKFISSAQWTYLVQKRLGDSMLSFGEPEPPDIKERSGRFRQSVDVTANYRTKTIQYTYNPLYRSLQHYGYRPELQVERSIRQVAQDLYAREFSILRRGGLS